MTSLFDRVFPKPARRRKVVERLYSAIMEKARHPALFAQGFLPDTMDGRFHAVTLYACLIFPKLQACGEEGRAISERLYTRLFDSFDAALRETGVGDASIARKIRKMGEHFFGIGQALSEALDESQPSEAVAAVLIRNGITEEEAASEVAAQLVSANASVIAAGEETLLSGNPGWDRSA